MPQTLYRHVLRDAWSATWRHPALWIFGAFALFMGQSQFFYALGGLFQLSTLTGTLATSAAGGKTLLLPYLSPNSFAQVGAGIGFAALVVVALILFLFMAIQSQGAIMAAGDLIFRKRDFSFKASWHAALEHFWALVGILLIKILVAAAVSFGVASLQYLVVQDSGVWWPKVLFVFGFVLFALIDIVITFVALFATCYVVLEKEKLYGGLYRAIRLFRQHWLASLEIGVIFLVCNLLATILTKTVIGVLFVPLVYFAALIQAASGVIAPALMLVLGILFFSAWFIMAIYNTWFFMSIVVLFDEMQRDAPVSKVMRFLKSLFSRA